MAGAALQRRLTWRVAEVIGTHQETWNVRTLLLAVPEWPGHRAGQHVDVRLTAEDGYQTQRSYSIASAPDGDERVELTIERLDDGEVSPYLVDELRTGDHLELRGPIGGYFVWEPAMGGPLLLVAGGSGICPLMSMLRLRAQAGDGIPTRLLNSSRSIENVIYREELERLASDGDGLAYIQTLTRSQPAGWHGPARRIDGEMLVEVAWPPAERPLVYVCGPTPMVESVADNLARLGHAPERIRTERFGPTGG